MLLAVDIGNTNIVIGLFEGRELKAEFRLKTDVRRTRDEYRVLMAVFLRERFGSSRVVGRSVVCSVVPPITPLFVALIGEEFGLAPLVVGPGIKTGISIRTLNPSAVGADRVVNAVALKHFYGLPGLAIDFGTATSFDYVDSKGEYLGGLIIPGIEISLEALVSNTAKLPRIEAVWPDAVLGRDTVSAMQSGTVIGYHCMIEGLIDKLLAEVGPVQQIVATGGQGRVFAERSDLITGFDPYLTLKGMACLAYLNPPGAAG